ncbi:hypothetical protein PPL_06790 [Heterostelium album PN500]|uniref:EGF-like domain-containing protein n=1 Tax=Heterostelium pallidum (strain ATCC 26659 / Pp 5 / PN500) TaxID=670386 RepID=D3BFQ5_HETP5|nr:hypothetical protein PPL_06790 [Heterostelium album PN500]EFA79969.1 hypothetical protein PPL_06790 [Heterostelium album PN500]|eukprot:XP_020432089.1 hypothetical protein PPL_06790 [Heterostelium album PN500]
MYSLLYFQIIVILLVSYFNSFSTGAIVNYSYWANPSQNNCPNSLISLITDSGTTNITKITNNASYKQYPIAFPTKNVFHLGIDVPVGSYNIDLTVTPSTGSPITYPVTVSCNIPNLPNQIGSVSIVPSPSYGYQTPTYLVTMQTNSIFSIFGCATSNVAIGCSVATSNTTNIYILTLNFISFDLPLGTGDLTIYINGASSQLQFIIPSPQTIGGQSSTWQSSFKYPGDGSAATNTMVKSTGSILNVVHVDQVGSYLFTSLKTGNNGAIVPMYGPVESTAASKTFVNRLAPQTTQISTMLCDSQVTRPAGTTTNFTLAADPTFSFTDPFAITPVSGGADTFITYTYSSLYCKNLQFKFFNRNTRNVDYPFGINARGNSVSNLQTSYQFSFPTNFTLNYYDAFPNTILQCGKVSAPFNVSPALAPVTMVLPYISDFQTIPFTYQSVIVRVEITTAGVAFHSLMYGPNNAELLSYRDLVSGDLYKGYYEKEIFFGKQDINSYYPLIVMDLTYNSYAYQRGSVLNTKKQILDFNFPTPIDVSLIENLVFQNNTMDLTGNSANNTIFFQINGPIPNNFVPVIQFDFEFSDPIIAKGTFNYSNNYATIPFTLPKNLINGTIKYSLYLPFKLSWESLYGKFGSQMLLNITSQVGDQMPPIIYGITSSAQGLVITFNLSIRDTNGFQSGYLNLTSDLDVLPYNVEFNLGNLTTGTAQDGSYKLIVNIEPSGPSQTFTIVDAMLKDQSGFYSKMNSINGIDPFSSIYNTSAAAFMSASISGYVSGSYNPTMTQINGLPTTIDTCSPNRFLSFQFIINDDSQVSPRHNPWVYLATYGYDVLPFPSKLVSDNNDYNTFSVNASLPYGFGMTNTIYISIYGFSDRSLNYAGVTTGMIKDGNVNPYKTSNSRSMTPSLEYAQPIYSYGGSVTISGFGFGLDKSVFSISVKLNNGTTLTPSPVMFGGTFFSFPMAAFSDPIKVTVTKSSKTSNTLTINPIPPPPQIPIPPNNTETTTTTTSTTSTTSTTDSTTTTSTTGDLTTGTSTTGQLTTGGSTTSTTTTSTTGGITCPAGCVNGNCIAQGTCECNKGYYGPTCNSQTDPNANPDPNENDPTIEDISTTISIVEIREMDNLNNPTISYPVGKYNWTRLNMTKPSDVNLKYVYNVQLNNSLNTYVNVTIDWFNVATSFPFGKRQLNMSANTAKYSIYISQFPFADRLNYLQVIMKIGINATDSECSSKQIGGDQSNLQWINLKVGDRSLYGRFVEYGVIDGNEQVVYNQLLDGSLEPTSTDASASTVAIKVQHYESSALLDPDFQYLLDSDSSGRTDELCKSSSGLDKAKLAGIIVGCGVFAIAATIMIIYSVKRARTQKKLRESMNVKLGSVQDH